MSPRVVIVSTMRDEGPHLVEWIAHHRAAGAEILVLSNNCTDGSDKLLDRLAESGAIAHLRNEVPEGKTPQWSALKLARHHSSVQEADWIAVLDADEFVNLRPPLATFQDFVTSVPGADAVMLPWRLFGHSGHATRPEAPTIRAYTRAIAADALYPPLCRFFKTLYRREGPFAKPGVHRPRLEAEAQPDLRDGSGRRVSQAMAIDDRRILHWGEPAATNLVQLNHYSVRSAEDFLLKAARGLPNRTQKRIGLTYWVERNFNTVEDTSIRHMAPATEAEARRLRTLPGVAEAEADCRAWQRAAFQRMLQDPALVEFYGRLLISQGSTAPDEALARELVSLFQTAHKASRR
ncbi:glycosyltransferase family 2 protein [Tranquillimonas alkanivorans]|uniref:Glycosyl transferase family 2 n=1 Tax=Tranquillimonas alkanivorans TaxID=441119 RepID=A0A1I5R6H0_9RHOB|nr:glycosyltransferase family 2 protein [Tranquillimonas alkanivorans]SFP53901.1 Glycosyl transferase family 2 [Tranquillimonas alkanivorans]